jgi:hypothetical protein
MLAGIIQITSILSGDLSVEVILDGTTATFVVETGAGLSNANAYCTIAEADQYHLNHGHPIPWTMALQADKEDAIRQATQYIDLNYVWKYIKYSDTQALEWPKRYVTDKNGFAIGSNIIPQQIKNACAFLALQVINGDVLISVQQDESAVKRTSYSVGPIAESIEYVGGETPEKGYTIADKLVREFCTAAGSGIMELERA